MTNQTPESVIAEVRKHLHYPGSPEDNWCIHCAEDWPCVTRRLADALEARAAVPDAATEQTGGELAACLELRAYWRSKAIEARAERDSATAAIERVRAVHVRDEYGLCVACSWEYPDASYDAISNDVAWPCPTVAALEGAPEPEWEYVGVAFEHGGFMRIRNDQLVPEKFESWRKLMTKYPRVEILKRVKAVPAGPWLPVEGESE